MPNTARKGDRSQRKHVRLRPAVNTLASVYLGNPGEGFGPPVDGLVVSDSYFGVGVVLPGSISIKVNKKCWVAIGKTSAYEAEVRWIRPLEFGLVAAGFEYLNPDDEE